ncbi:flagellar type III secretion system pore protein FliP [Conexibacter stalactiti]|uniref:Flagellar biosynthetic protein FliP n=1 Tax=Conexibacter stalactiti TaxID=1940611 RepID=A0ABU4HWK2_9ACTN|nr:flagellar type III secretion system pore protein FliP [Conexibacter stalactiti]MDW5597683.1 flagellar type III secretion system pore protein FliP [Conexibacter stalactiti]MEC5038325.1 flagellar type III secretion system pore protein FliP [Conexibacter stalactiti]
MNEVSGDSAIQVLLLVGALTLIPAALFCLTGFTRILIVLGFIRTAIGTPTSPPNQVLVGIALFLTIFVMAPTFNQIKTTAWDPLEANRITTAQAVERAQIPLREFMFEQTRTKDLALMVRLSQTREQPRTYRDIPTTTLIPAFIISELKTAFQIGFMIFLPFLIIDLIVASTLMSMGMIMLPPVFISLPFKILLFVLVDGWALITDSLVRSFSG